MYKRQGANEEVVILSGKKRRAELKSKWVSSVTLRKLPTEIPTPPFSFFEKKKCYETIKFYLSLVNFTECVCIKVKRQEEHRRPSKRWDRVPIKLLRPVGKRTMAEVVHVAATRLVWQRREYTCTCVDVTQHSHVCHRAAMTETQVPEHSGGSGLDHENGPPRGVPRVCDLCLSTGAVAGNQPAVAVGWVILKDCTAYVRRHVGFLFIF